MQRLINTLATAGASVVLMAGLWQDWSLVTTLKRMLIAYMASFFLGSLMALVIKAAPLFEKSNEPNPDSESDQAQRKKVLA